MTIRTMVEIQAYNNRLSNLEYCSAFAPEGTYAFAKSLVAAFQDAMGNLHRELSISLEPLGLKVSNTDDFREIEALVYSMLIRNNRQAGDQLAVAEGFGEHVTSTMPGHSGKTVGENVLEGAIRDKILAARAQEMRDLG